MSLSPLSWRSVRFLRSVPENLLLQYIDKVVVVLYVQSYGRQSSSHSCSLDKVVDMPVVFNDSPWFNVQKTAVVPQLLRVFLVAGCPCCAGRVGAAFCGYGRPVIMQRQDFSSMVEVVQFLDKVVAMPVIFMTVQFLDKAVDMPVVSNDGCLSFPSRKLWRLPSCSSMAVRRWLWTSLRSCSDVCLFNSIVPQIPFTARVVDIPVVQQRPGHSFQQWWLWR